MVPDALPALKDEIIAVISKYMDIDTQAMHIDVAREQGSVALRANIPILSWKKRPDHEVDL